MSTQNSDILCCISTWHRESNGLNFYDVETKDSKILYPSSTSIRLPIGSITSIDQINEKGNSINSGPIGRYRFRNYLESNSQIGNMNITNISNIFRLLTDWRKSNELKNDFVMELIDFIRLCGIKKNLAYKDLFELLSKIFKSKLKTKKIVDDITYAKFDELALRCVKMINIPHLIDSVIMLLSKFNRLSEKVIKELTTPDLYLFPRFLSFYKSAPIKLRQQMWLRRPRWFVYEILPFIMLFNKLFFNVDCSSILNISEKQESSRKSTFVNEIKDLLKFIKVTNVKFNSEKNFKGDVDSYLQEYLKNAGSCDLNEIEFVQQSDSVDSIFSFVSRIQALYTSCVELEHDDMETFGESCKCLAFNFMDSVDFYKSFIQLQKSELFLPINSVDIPVLRYNNFSFVSNNISANFDKTNFTNLKTQMNCKNNSTSSFNFICNTQKIITSQLKNSNSSQIYNLNICGNILNLGRIVSYISYCIGNHRELYIYFVNTVKQLYIDSLFHNIGSYSIKSDHLSNKRQVPLNSFQSETLVSEDNNFFSQLTPMKSGFSLNKNNIDSLKVNPIRDIEIISKPEKIKDNFQQNYLNLNMSEQKQDFNSESIKDFKQKSQYQLEQKLNNFSGEPSLSTLRIFVALRIFHFDNKINRSDDEERKGIDNEKSGTLFNNDLNSERNFVDLSKNDSNSSLAISECDPIIWPCIHIVGNILKDGFSSNKSQESLVNISSTLIIKSKDELADISFIFSEPHFLFICSEFIIETSILTMFHSSMDALLVLNPQRRKIPIALISLGLNSPYLSYINKNSLLNSSNFLYNSTNKNSTNSVTTSNMGISSQVAVNCISQTASPFGKINITESNLLFNGYSSSKKKLRKVVVNDLISTAQNICPSSQQNVNFAIRFDTLLNLLTSFNNNGSDNRLNESSIGNSLATNSMQFVESDINNSHSVFGASINTQASSTILGNINKLQNAVFTTFLPLIDRYLELSISPQKTNIGTLNTDNEIQNKTKRNELLKSIRNELKDYVNSILSLKKRNNTSNLTLRFIRLISTSLFFTGIKPALNRMENSSNTLHLNINGLSYLHIHNPNFIRELTSKSCNNQFTVPSLPSCINLSIRLLEISFCSDWLNQMFLKSILGLLYTFPRPSIKCETNHSVVNMENKDLFGKQNCRIANSSLLASAPSDIIQGLLFRIILPSIRDPLIASSEINTIYEIMNNNEISLLLDNKTKKLFIERFWTRNPFQFTINTSHNEKEHLISESSQKIHIKDLYHHILNFINDLKTIEDIYLDIPYKKMLWEHHFIDNNDAYFVFFKWLIYFLKLCTNLEKENPFFNKILLINNLLRKFYKTKSQEFTKG